MIMGAKNSCWRVELLLRVPASDSFYPVISPLEPPEPQVTDGWEEEA